MDPTLYEGFRGASGFTLLIVGLSFLLGPPRDKAYLALGTMFLSVGGLFLLSALEPTHPLPLEVGNLAVTILVFGVSQSLFELTLRLFGDLKTWKDKWSVYLSGMVLSLAVWGIPLLDSVFNLPPAGTSIEDGHTQGILHTVFGPLVYVWPMVVTLLSAQIGRWRLRDLSVSFQGIRTFLWGLGALMVILAGNLAALTIQNTLLYQVSQTALEVLMLVWFFYVNRHPDEFDQLHRQVLLSREQGRYREQAEAEQLAARLRALAADERQFRDPELDLRTLALKLGVAEYRLSACFNQNLDTNFPRWLNGLRIEWARKRICDDPTAKVLDIAFEAGYRSKTTFNTQFQKIVGVSPTEYRKSPF